MTELPAQLVLGARAVTMVEQYEAIRTEEAWDWHAVSESVDYGSTHFVGDVNPESNREMLEPRCASCSDRDANRPRSSVGLGLGRPTEHFDDLTAIGGIDLNRRPLDVLFKLGSMGRRLDPSDGR